MVVVEQGQGGFNVGIDVLVSLAQRATLIDAHTGLLGVGDTHVLISLLRVIGHAEDVGCLEHGISAAEQCFGALTTQGGIVADSGQSLVSGSGSLIATVPERTRVVVTLGLNVLPVVYLVLVWLSPIGYTVVKHVVGTDFKDEVRQIIDVGRHQELCNLVLGVQLSAVVRQLVKEVVTRRQSYGECHDCECYIFFHCLNADFVITFILLLET